MIGLALLSLFALAGLVLLPLLIVGLALKIGVKLLLLPLRLAGGIVALVVGLLALVVGLLVLVFGLVAAILAAVFGPPLVVLVVGALLIWGLVRLLTRRTPNARPTV